MEIEQGRVGFPGASFNDAFADDPSALFAWGEKDWLVPARFEHHVTRALTTSQSVVLADCGQVPQCELPELTSKLIREFIGTRTLAA